MTDNTVNNVYTDKIYSYVDEYIDNLSDGDTKTDKAVRDSLIKKTPIFKGMLKYIFINVFKITDKDIKYNNKNSRIDYGDIDVLNNIWDIYTGLCYKYCQNPTILNFSLFTGIDMSTIDSWRTGNDRAYIYYDSNGDMIKDIAGYKLNHQGQEIRQELSSSHANAVKKWLKECESAAYDVALSGNPGGMFILKANYGYTEAPQQVQIVDNNRIPISREQIAQEIGSQLVDNAGAIDLPGTD